MLPSFPPPPQLVRLNDKVFAVLDSELVMLMHTERTPRPTLLGLAFRTRLGWRVLRLGSVDIGYAPDAVAALGKLVEDASKYPSLYPVPAYKGLSLRTATIEHALPL